MSEAKIYEVRFDLFVPCCRDDKTDGSLMLFVRFNEKYGRAAIKVKIWLFREAGIKIKQNTVLNRQQDAKIYYHLSSPTDNLCISFKRPVLCQVPLREVLVPYNSVLPGAYLGHRLLNQFLY